MSEVNMTSARKAAEAVRAAREKLAGEKVALEQERDALKARSEFLLSLPVAREDAKQFIFDSIDRIGAEFPELGRWHMPFLDYAYPKGGGRREKQGAPLTLRDIEQMSGDGVEVARVLGSAHLSFYAAPLAEFAASRLYFFFGDLIKAKIEEHFEQFFPHFHVKHPDQALTVVERRAEIVSNSARIEAIDAEIITIEQQLLELRA